METMTANVSLEAEGIKEYNEVIEKETSPSVEIKEIVKNDGYVKEGNTLIKPIRLENLTKDCRKLVQEKGKGWITRNSKCPCDSGKRFKNCCMELKPK